MIQWIQPVSWFICHDFLPNSNHGTWLPWRKSLIIWNQNPTAWPNFKMWETNLMKNNGFTWSDSSNHRFSINLCSPTMYATRFEFNPTFNLKTSFKLIFFHRCQQKVPYRAIYPEAAVSEWKLPKKETERSLNVLQLIDANIEADQFWDTFVDATNEVADDEESEGNENWTWICRFSKKTHSIIHRMKFRFLGWFLRGSWHTNVISAVQAYWIDKRSGR